LNVEI